MKTVKDPKASILPGYSWIPGDVSTASHVSYNSDPRFIPIQLISIIYCIQNASILALFFYDSPNLPVGIFDDFLAIPQRSSDIGTRGMASMAKTAHGQTPGRWVAEIGGPME